MQNPQKCWQCGSSRRGGSASAVQWRRSFFRSCKLICRSRNGWVCCIHFYIPGVSCSELFLHDLIAITKSRFIMISRFIFKSHHSRFIDQQYPFCLFFRDVEDATQIVLP